MDKAMILLTDKGGGKTDMNFNRLSITPGDISALDTRMQTFCTLLHTSFVNARITTRQYAVTDKGVVTGNATRVGRFMRASEVAHMTILDVDGKAWPIDFPMPADVGVIAGQDGRYHIVPAFGDAIAALISTAFGATYIFSTGFVRERGGANGQGGLTNGIGILFEDSEGAKREMTCNCGSTPTAALTIALAAAITTGLYSNGKIVGWRIKQEFSFAYGPADAPNTLTVGKQDLVKTKALCRFIVTSGNQIIARIGFKLPTPQDTATETIQAGKRKGHRKITTAKGATLAAGVKALMGYTTENVLFTGGNVYGK